MRLLTLFFIAAVPAPAQAGESSPAPLIKETPAQVLCIYPRNAGKGDPDIEDSFLRNGRVFRRVGTRRSPSPARPCFDSTDPLCLREKQELKGSPAQGGYYYGWFRDSTGRMKYGRLYLPHYGKYDGNAKNEPPPVCRTPKKDEGPEGGYRPIEKR